VLGQFGRVRHHLKFGFKRIEVGFKSVKFGPQVKVERIEVGFESVKLGPEQVKVKRIEVGFESVKLGSEQIDGIFFVADTQFCGPFGNGLDGQTHKDNKKKPDPEIQYRYRFGRHGCTP
jgi:hypothetical protein